MERGGLKQGPRPPQVVSLMRTVLRTLLLPELRVHSSSLAFSNQYGKVFLLSGVLKPHESGKF